MPGEVDRLVADALHQAAVAGEHISEMIDEFVAETRRLEALRYRHADGGREALAERPGGRLDARRVAIFGMARRFSSRAGGIVSDPRCRGRDSRRDSRARRAASSRVRRRARSGRGPANGDRRRRISESLGTARWPRRPCPSACRDGRTWPFRPRPSPAREWRWRLACCIPLTDRSSRVPLADALAAPHEIEKILGVSMSCMARSSLLPGMTMELARDIQLPAIIVTR